MYCPPGAASDKVAALQKAGVIVTDSPAKIGSEMLKVGNVSDPRMADSDPYFVASLLRRCKLLDSHKCHVDNPYWLHNRVIFALEICESTLEPHSQDDYPVLSFTCV
jgi:hypothetical protein